MLTIGKLGSSTGVKIPTIRYYEQMSTAEVNQPSGGAKRCHFEMLEMVVGRGERLGARARHIAGACQGALARQGQSAGQGLAAVFCARLWVSR